MLQNQPAPESRTLPQHSTDEHNGLSYTLHGDYYSTSHKSGHPFTAGV